MINYTKLSAGRLIKYWARRAQVQTVKMLICMAVFFVYGIIFRSNSSLADTVSILPYITALVGIAMTWVFTVSDMSDVSKISIWLGSTRKEMFAGHILSSGIYIFNIVALYLLSVICTGNLSQDIYINTAIGMIGALFLVTALSKISGVARIMYSSQSDMYCFFILVIIVIAIVITFVYVYGGYSNMVKKLCVVVLITGIISNIVFSLVYYKMLDRYDAR